MTALWFYLRSKNVPLLGWPRTREFITFGHRYRAMCRLP